MGKPTGFMEISREMPEYRPVSERVRDFQEFTIQLPLHRLQQQGARCMECGVPFCHAGCPLGNVMPEFNDCVYRGDWQEALRVLLETNNFPEFTGRICPAPCEEACVLSIHEPAVTIRNIERAIIERAFELGWIRPEPPTKRTGKKVAVIGSGPAGLAAAQQLNRAGHTVTVFERDERVGGLLRYGIPNFKLEKWIIDRRVNLMEEEGIQFRTGIEVGRDLSGDELRADYDAVVLCIGTPRPRDLNVPGRDLRGVYFAMEFLTAQNRRLEAQEAQKGGSGQAGQVAGDDLWAADKNVIVIGGGDTGADCVGTANRQGARSVVQFELLPKPPVERPEGQPWPYWPTSLRTGTSHEEGCQRVWSILTKEIHGSEGKVVGIETVDVEWTVTPDGKGQMCEKPETRRHWPADMVLLAMGFLGPETGSVTAQLGAGTDSRGNIEAGANYMTDVPGIFACGDSRRGQSLVVWAISEGREAARSVDLYLMGNTALPTKGSGDLPRRV